MDKEKIVILGAGLTGLSAAYHLEKSDRGSHYQIFEKEDSAGGLCRSKRVDGFTFDYDGHLLHFKHEYARGLIKELLNGNLVEHQRNSWVYSSGTYTRYPFQANLFGLAPTVAKECLLGFIGAVNRKYISSNGKSFEEWIFQTFGQGISRHFMLPYNRKFWTVPLKELSCEWIDGFIPTPSLEEVIEGAVAESKRKYGYNTSFWYPKIGGIQGVARAFSKRVKKIETSEAAKIDLAGKEITFKDGRKVGYEKLISSIPLPELAKLIRSLPKEIAGAFKVLKWTSIFNLNLGIDRKDLSDKHWIYFPDEEFIFFRAGFPHNFSSALAPPGKSSLYIEVSYSRDRPVQKETIIQRIIEDLQKADILTREDKILVEDINDIKYGYVIYDKHRNTAVKNITDFLKQHQIFSLGRFGSWRYMSMEEAVLEGKKIAEVLQGDRTVQGCLKKE